MDSSVWVDYLSHRPSKVEQKLEALIRPHNQVVTTGIIFQEVLQGIRNEISFRLTQKLLLRLPFLVPEQNTFVLASELFRKLVSKGKKPHTVDVLIAALATQNKIPLFTLDSDFLPIEKNSSLELFR